MNSNNDPITGPIVPVFLHYAVPSVIGMLAATSAGIIDGIFIGNYVGATALAAVNISWPVFALFIAIVFMLAVGGSVMCGKFIGSGDTSAADFIFSKTIYTNLIASVLICVLITLSLDAVIGILGANDALRPLVRDYLVIVVPATPFFVLGLTLDYFVRVDGRPRLASGALVAFAALNVLLDWLFIAKLGWGIKGAAWATAISEGCIFFILITHWLGSRWTLRLRSIVDCHRDGWNSIVRAAYNGFSEFSNGVSIGLLTLLFNWVMITRLGVEGVAAFTIINYLLLIGLEVCYGISESLQPLVSKNLGAGQPRRITQFTLLAILSSLAIGLVVCSLLLLIPETLITLFLGEGEERTIEITAIFIAFFWPAFLFNGMNLTLASFFTALHKPMPSALIALCRSLLFPGIALLLLPPLLGDKGIYISIPIAEALTFAVALILLKVHWKKAQ